MFIAIVLALVAIYLAYRVQRYYKYDKYYAGIPTEFSYPVLGNAFKLGFTPAEYLQNLTLWWKKFGYGMFKVDVGPETYVFINDPNDVEVILSSSVNINKMEEYKFFWPWLGHGLITSAGAKWHAHRKMITPSFHFKILNNFLYTINDNSSKFVEVLRELATGETFDLQPLANYYTTDVICETSMGIQINSMTNHDAKLVKYFHSLTRIIIGRFFSAIKRIEFLFRFTDEYKEQNDLLKKVHDFNESVILKRKALLKEEVKDDSDENEFSMKKRQAFLDTLLSTSINGVPLTTQQVSDEVSTFIFAGRETTAASVSFTSYCLSIYPELQKKVFDELYAIFGNDTERHPTYQELQELPYMDLFIKECLRLYTTVPFFGRKLSKPATLSGREFPAGASIMLFTHGMHLNPKVFPDPEKFDPERFLPENRVGRHPYEYVPFSAGPRNCIGQKFALLELKSAMSAIVRNFEILPTEDKNFKPILAATAILISANGVFMKLKPRVYK